MTEFDSILEEERIYEKQEEEGLPVYRIRRVIVHKPPCDVPVGTSSLQAESEVVHSIQVLSW